MMKIKGFILRRVIPAALSSAMLFGAASAQTPTPTAEQIQVFKNLPKDQQDAILQGVAGKGGATGNKQPKDNRVDMPETVKPKSDVQLDEFGKPIKDKTKDGRPLRLHDEDPELRPGDTVLIELSSKLEEEESIRRRLLESKAGDIGQLNNGAANTFPKRQRPMEDKRTDEEKKRSEDLRKRIVRDNPYQLNRFGILELPGLQAIPLAGLTAEEATERLNADPDLADFVAKLSLLRLRQFGDEALKPFGYDLFEGVPTTFAPVTDIPVPGDYVLGPGDALSVQLYGNEPASYSLSVDRDGRISFPKLGPIMVGGMSFDSARAAIERRVGSQLIGSRASVSMGDLRTIRVFVLGEAEKPGSYTVSGLSTMTNALLVSGGVKKIGSLRRIQLKRAGKLVTTLDLYDLLLNGDTSGDRKLVAGDVIFIPPIGPTVSVSGEVRRPAIYEIKDEKSVADVVRLAGGLTPDADSRRGALERITGSGLRVTRSFDLSGDARNENVANGDKLRIAIIRPTLENSVTLQGHVFRPGAFEYRDGMRLSNIISSFDELRPNADRHYVMIRREVAPERRLEVVSADLEVALSAPGTEADVALKPRDQVYVFDLSNDRQRAVEPLVKDLELQGTIDHPAQIVGVSGKVKAPGRYPLETSMHVSDLIRAGGSLEDAAYGGQAELTRYSVINGEVRQTELINVDLAAIRRGDSTANLALRPYDMLVIKETPAWDQEAVIEIVGEVRFPGKYPIQRGETLHSVLQRAGGVTELAFSRGAVFTREDLKKREKEQIEILSNRFQSDLTSLSLEALANTSNNNSAGQAVAVGQQLIEELRNAKPVGRLVINLDQVMRVAPGAQGDIVLKEGDKLIVPKKAQEVTILGEVQSPTSHLVQPGLTRDDYISQSGGITKKADKSRIYVVRADGSVISNERRGWFRRGESSEMMPGDTIVVPLDAERIRPLPLWTAVSTIIYNLAIAATAVSRF